MSEPTKNNPSEKNPAEKSSFSFLDTFMDSVRSLGLRIVVHISAFFCAGVVANFVPSFAALATYTGLICLVARDMRMHVTWLMPLGLGLGQMLLAWGIGLPFYEALFWGGAQAFVQRMFMKRYAMGSEWGAAVLLFPLALKFCASSPYIALTLGSFALIAGGGYMFWQVRARLALKKEAIQEAHKKMAEAAASAAPFAQENSVAEYKASIAKLRTKQLLLPKSMQASVAAISKSTEAMLVCMQEDRRDKEPGEKFLRRYLPATHAVLENYCRLAGTAKANTHASEDITAALQHSEEVLQRLEQAFAHEHSALLRNDIDDFSADLKVLDTLLKMEGR